MLLRNYLEIVNFEIESGYSFLWNCYGPNAQGLDYWNKKHGLEEIAVHCVFDTETRELYEVVACDGKNSRVYKWVNSKYYDALVEESKQRNIDHKIAWDDVRYIFVDEFEDIEGKAKSIFRGEEYDTRILLKIDLTEEEELQIMRLAHERDMTVNKFIEYILEQEIERFREKPIS